MYRGILILNKNNILDKNKVIKSGDIVKNTNIDELIWNLFLKFITI